MKARVQQNHCPTNQGQRHQIWSTKAAHMCSAGIAKCLIYDQHHRDTLPNWYQIKANWSGLQVQHACHPCQKPTQVRMQARSTVHQSSTFCLLRKHCATNGSKETASTSAHKGCNCRIRNKCISRCKCSSRLSLHSCKTQLQMR
jgi:hypothetical protein